MEIKEKIIKKLGGFTRKEILEKVADYTIPRTWANNKTGADYIYIYDLRTFVLKK